MTADHLEVEDKYHLDESAVLPDFGAMAGVRSVSVVDHELVATYFDTPSLALAETGITLRRRTGGEDAGWHLKLPRGSHRVEIVLPPGRAVRTPPAALRKVVAGVIRDEELAAVVTIRTERRVRRLHGKKGDVLAEVVDDRVTGEPVTSEAPGPAPIAWREAQVELVSGTPSLLVWAADLMASVGARRSESPSKLVQALGDRLPPDRVIWPEPGKKSPAGDVIQLRLLAQTAALRQLDPWVRHGAAEATQDMQLTVRRVWHALASYRAFLDPEQTEPLRDELDWLAWLLDAPCKAETLDELLRSLVVDEPESLVTGPVPARIEGHFRRRNNAARGALRSALDSPRYFDLVDRLQSVSERPPWTEEAQKKAGRALSKSLDEDWKRLRAQVLRAGDAGDRWPGELEDLDDLRTAATRVQCAAEALTPLPGRGAKRMVKAHQRIQAALGDQLDDAEAQVALVELADAAASASENAFTYGLLHARVQARAASHAADFDQAWQDSVTARARLLKR